jgi:hypothetical protein
MGRVTGKVAVVSGAARYITGQQLRVDGGGFLKVKPWSGG